MGFDAIAFVECTLSEQGNIAEIAGEVLLCEFLDGRKRRFCGPGWLAVAASPSADDTHLGILARESGKVKNFETSNAGNPSISMTVIQLDLAAL